MVHAPYTSVTSVSTSLPNRMQINLAEKDLSLCLRLAGNMNDLPAVPNFTTLPNVQEKAPEETGNFL